MYNCVWTCLICNKFIGGLFALFWCKYFQLYAIKIYINYVIHTVQQYSYFKYKYMYNKIFICHPYSVWIYNPNINRSIRGLRESLMDFHAFLAFSLRCTGWKAYSMFGRDLHPDSDNRAWSPQCLIGFVVTRTNWRYQLSFGRDQESRKVADEAHVQLHVGLICHLFAKLSFVLCRSVC